MAQKRRLSDNDLYLRSIKEKDFMNQVIEMAERLGWLVYHPHQSLYDRAGYPDLTCIHLIHGFFVSELKTETGRLREEQKKWKDHFLEQKVEYHLWRPSDWPEIEKRLKGITLLGQNGSGRISLLSPHICMRIDRL